MVLSGEGADSVRRLPLLPCAGRPRIPRRDRTQTAGAACSTARAPTRRCHWGVEARVPFLDEIPRRGEKCASTRKMENGCGNGKMEKHIVRECFESYLPASVAWHQKSSSPTASLQLDRHAKKRWLRSKCKSTARNRAFPLPVQHADVEEGSYLCRENLRGAVPLPKRHAECVPGGPSVCSSAKAIEWDESFKKMDDPSGRAVGV